MIDPTKYVVTAGDHIDDVELTTRSSTSRTGG